MRVAVGAMMLVLAMPAVAQVGASPVERELLRLSNRTREERGMPPPVWDAALARAARLHARWMASRPRELEHQYPGEWPLAARAGDAGARFSAISENLARGEGATAGAIEESWVRSAVHRQNLLDRSVNAVGMGVVEIGGVMFVTGDFAREVPVMGAAEIEERVAAEVRRLGVGTVTVGEAARRSCAGEDVAKALVEGWDGTEPTRLPDRLVARVRSGAFRRAEVGACASEREEAGFQTFRVAVLLF